MASCAILLEDDVVSGLLQELDNVVVFEEINVPLGVGSARIFEKFSLASANYPCPYHDGDRELFIIHVVLSPLLTRHMIGQSGDEAKRDSSVNTVVDQSSFTWA